MRRKKKYDRMKTSGSLDSKLMGVAKWKTPMHPLMASSKLPSSSRLAFHSESLLFAPPISSKCFTSFISSAPHHIEYNLRI